MDVYSITKKTWCLLFAGISFLLAVLFFNGNSQYSIIFAIVGGLLFFFWNLSYLRELDDRLKQIENK